MKDHIELPPIRENKDDWDEIEAKIKLLFKREIYSPLVKEFSVKGVLKNSREGLLEAIQSGRLTFNRGKFSGKLNSTLSGELRALGAKWDRSQKCYTLPLDKLPHDVRNAISTSAWRFEQKISRLDEKLSKIVPSELAKKLKLTDLFDKAIFKVEKDFEKTTKNITVAPVFTAKRRQDLAAEWQNNMELWITDFTAKEIVELRKNLRKSIFSGNRFESAVKTIQESYGVSERKAKFLARQETQLAMTTYKYSRYEEAGIGEYKWKCVVGTPSHPVRPQHRKLNDASAAGKIFRFDDPPVTTEPGEAERRNNPGTDYNCRCTAIPVVRFKK